MKKLLNTLYITTENSRLRKDGENLVVQFDDSEVFRVPKHLIGSIVCFGRVGITVPFLEFCARNGISISYLSKFGKFQARVEGPLSGNVLLRRAQHNATTEPRQILNIARSIIAAKISNQRTLLRRALRDYTDSMSEMAVNSLKNAEIKLHRAAKKAFFVKSTDELRGIEGDAASTYFSCFDYLIRRNESEFRFNGRNRRPPQDAPNAVLSFLYSIITHDCRSALETVGLDCQMGFLHRDRPGRASLALDLLEEFRTPIAERVCLTLLNRKQLQIKDFRFESDGSVLLTDAARKTVLSELQNRKTKKIKHPFTDEKAQIGLLPFIQAQLLARFLRGDIDGYPPFVWR